MILILKMILQRLITVVKHLLKHCLIIANMLEEMIHVILTIRLPQSLENHTLVKQIIKKHLHPQLCPYLNKQNITQQPQPQQQPQPEINLNLNLTHDTLKNNIEC